MTEARPSKPLFIATIGVGISGILHAIAPFIHGWVMPLTLFIPIALLYAFFVFGLKRGISWLPTVVLVCMVIGGLGSLYEIYRISPISQGLLVGISIADFTAAGALIAHLRAPTH